MCYLVIYVFQGCMWTVGHVSSLQTCWFYVVGSVFQPSREIFWLSSYVFSPVYHLHHCSVLPKRVKCDLFFSLVLRRLPLEYGKQSPTLSWKYRSELNFLKKGQSLKLYLNWKKKKKINIISQNSNNEKVTELRFGSMNVILSFLPGESKKVIRYQKPGFNR